MFKRIEVKEILILCELINSENISVANAGIKKARLSKINTHLFLDILRTKQKKRRERIVPTMDEIAKAAK